MIFPGAVVLASLLAWGAIAPTSVHAPVDVRADFVRVVGNRLVLDGANFRFAGANLALMHGPESRRGATALLDEAARDGIRVGRIWAFGEGPPDAAAWQKEGYYFRAGASGWIEAAPAHLDRVLAAAARDGLRLIITLSNSWPDYGGLPQYLRWAGPFQKETFGATDRFYSDPRARAAFRAHVERLLGRTNAITGVPYRDDPTILAWELMNESHVETAAGARARRAWVVEMARLAHRLDRHHLVTAGVTGYRLERERADWLAVCRLPEVDYCDGHFYPEEMLGARDAGLLEAFIDDYAQLALHVAGKPFVLGEFGVRGDAGGLWRGETRAAWTARIFERLRVDGAAGGLIWIYQTTPGAVQSHAISVGEPAAAPVRAAVRAAAEALASFPSTGPLALENPRLGPALGAAPLFPLRADVEGPTPVTPSWPLSATATTRPTAAVCPRPGASREEDKGEGPSANCVQTGDRAPAPEGARVTWDPLTYARARWEANGAYRGGKLAHVWGTETGFFEYDYAITSEELDGQSPGPPEGQGGGASGALGRRRARPPRRLWVRARVSSEFPGNLSPPDGASVFEITIDGVVLGRARAVRDDGVGAVVTVATSRADVIRAAVSAGVHHLRFSVKPGPHAHGLCLYGGPGEKPEPGLPDTPIVVGWTPDGAAGGAE